MSKSPAAKRKPSRAAGQIVATAGPPTAAPAPEDEKPGESELPNSLEILAEYVNSERFRRATEYQRYLEDALLGELAK